MSKQSISVRTSNVTIGNAAAEIFTTATQTVRVTEIDISMAGAGGGTFGIGRPAAAGITPTAPVTLLLHDLSDQAASAQVAVAWGTGPTVPAAFMYRITVPPAIGSQVSISIPEGIVIPVPGGTLIPSLVLWNISGTDIADVTFIVSTKPLAQILANF